MYNGRTTFLSVLTMIPLYTMFALARYHSNTFKYILRNALGGRGSRILLRFVTLIGGGGEGTNDHLLRNDYKFSKCLKFQKHHFLVISISVKLLALEFSSYRLFLYKNFL